MVPGAEPSVSGTKPSVEYPRQEGWTNDPSGVEPSLGYSIEDQECCGQPFEVEASAASVGFSFLSANGDAAGAGEASSSPPTSGAISEDEAEPAPSDEAAALSTPNPGSAAGIEATGPSPSASLGDVDPASLPQSARELLELLFSKPGKDRGR
jgi:hypothetical protein